MQLLKTERRRQLQLTLMHAPNRSTSSSTAPHDHLQPSAPPSRCPQPAASPRVGGFKRRQQQQPSSLAGGDWTSSSSLGEFLPCRSSLPSFPYTVGYVASSPSPFLLWLLLLLLLLPPHVHHSPRPPVAPTVDRRAHSNPSPRCSSSPSSLPSPRFSLLSISYNTRKPR